MILYLLEPLDEIFNDSTESLFGFSIIEYTRLVEFSFTTVPLNDEFFLKENLVAYYKFHEGRCIFQLIGITLLKEEDQSLQAMLDTNLTILADELKEGFLMFFPVLYDVTLGAEKAAN